MGRPCENGGKYLAFFNKASPQPPDKSGQALSKERGSKPSQNTNYFLLFVTVGLEQRENIRWKAGKFPGLLI